MSEMSEMSELLTFHPTPHQLLTLHTTPHTVL
jgi:hypothetical protein